MKIFIENNRALVAKKARIVMILMAVALMALPTMAQQQEWKSTSAMPGTGSTYSPQLTEVGATSAAEMGTTTTTETYSPSKGPRRVIGTNPDGGEGSNDSPIGDAMLPMLLCAAAFCGVIALRRKRSALKR